MDTVDKATRSHMMAQVKSCNTKPEILIRKGLFSRGYRYRLHVKSLPGHPDIVLPKYRTAIFVNGCFWHQHKCTRSRLPEANHEWWKKKLGENHKRDMANYAALVTLGWRLVIVWECSIRFPKARRDEAINRVLNSIDLFLRSNNSYLEIDAEILDT